MRYIFEHLGVAVFAITGVLAARNKRVDLFGVVVLALVTALGGGTVRDLILGIRPFWTADVSFALCATAAAALTFFGVRRWEVPPTSLLIADACGLAFFTVIGTLISDILLALIDPRSGRLSPPSLLRAGLTVRHAALTPGHGGRRLLSSCCRPLAT